MNHLALRVLVALAISGSALPATANASPAASPSAASALPSSSVGSTCSRVNQVTTVKIKNKMTQLVCVQEAKRRVWRVRTDRPSGNSGSKQHKFLNTTCSKSSDGKLTAKITDTETLEIIVPPGVAAGWEIKPHSYLRIKGERAAIYAPTDMDLVQGAFYKEPPTFQAKTTYVLHFAIGCEFAMYLDHITDPVNKIKAALNSTPNEDTRMDTFLSKAVSFKAGELIGYTIGAGPAGPGRLWDFGYYSSAVTNQYVNQERRLRIYAWKQLHAVCGYDYFSEPLKSTYASLFATHRGVIIPGAPCRNPNQDVAGTLAGSWFFKPDTGAVEPHVAVMGDLDGKSVIIAGLPQGYIWISGSNPTAKNPATVSSQHCYDSENGRYLYFVIVDRVTLDLYEGSGSCPASPSGTKLRLYR